MIDGKRIVLFIFLFIGFFLISIGGYFLYKEVSIRNWPVAEGIVLDLQIGISSQSGSTPSFKPLISYNYTVNGREYSNNRLTVISKTYGKEAEAEAVIARYAIQQKVDVLYNPRNPRDSVLIYQPIGVSYGIIFIGLLISSVCAFIAIKKKKSS